MESACFEIGEIEITMVLFYVCVVFYPVFFSCIGRYSGFFLKKKNLLVVVFVAANCRE